MRVKIKEVNLSQKKTWITFTENALDCWNAVYIFLFHWTVIMFASHNENKFLFGKF